MFEISLAEEFKLRYRNLPIDIQKKAEKQEKLFRQNQFYPSQQVQVTQPQQKQNIIQKAVPIANKSLSITPEGKLAGMKR